MKKLKSILVLALIIFAGTTFAQDLTPPKQGAVIRMETFSYDINSGDELAAEVYLVKSKSSKRTKFDGLVVRGPKGIDATIEERGNNFLMKIKIDDELAPAKYTLMLEGKGRNAHKIRSATFALNVTESEIIAEKE